MSTTLPVHTEFQSPHVCSSSTRPGATESPLYSYLELQPPTVGYWRESSDIQLVLNEKGITFKFSL